MHKDLTITLCQTDPVWCDISANIDQFKHIVSNLKQPTDLAIIPEMFSTGFTMQPELYAERNNGLTISTIHSISEEYNTAVCGSFIASDNNNYYNRLFFSSPYNETLFYDKRHLFTMGEENNHYTAGKEHLLVEYNGWRILPLICYDLRFPCWIRASVPFDLLIFVANWPEARKDTWLTLLKARAIENQCYVVGVNRIGKDRNGLSYSGNSIVFGPKGETIADAGSDICNITISLSMQKLMAFRKKFPVLEDRDQTIIK